MTISIMAKFKQQQFQNPAPGVPLKKTADWKQEMFIHLIEEVIE